MIGAPLDATVDLSAISDFVEPFQLERPQLRGRLVRLGPVLDRILTRHAYPFPVAQLLAEIIVAATILASLLKYTGVFTLQVKGSGPVRLIVADVTSEGAIRAYAQFDKDGLPQDRGPAANLPALVGAGYLAFTVDQGEDTERYQGIVSLEGEGLIDALWHYFAQSEQLATDMVMATALADGKWHGAAIIVQQMPEDERARITGTGDPDAWNRAVTLLATATREELLDSRAGEALDPNLLLYRLFHEEEVRVFTTHGVHEQCRCSEDRVRAVMAALPPEEVDELRVDGALIITCEFCNRTYQL